jgi:hypothetical protein
MSRYLLAVGGNSRKAMTLYRLNLRLSQELFTIESCFEIAFRNKIDAHYAALKGNDWLRNSAMPGGMFSAPNCGKTPYIIMEGHRRLHVYSHAKLLAEMELGFWRYLFANHQFRAGGQNLLRIFPSKPVSTPVLRYDHNFVFSELEKINNLRNRLAHHEPVCFSIGSPVKNTANARHHYQLMLTFFTWMEIDEAALLYGLDHIVNICNQIDAL